MYICNSPCLCLFVVEAWASACSSGVVHVYRLWSYNQQHREQKITHRQREQPAQHTTGEPASWDQCVCVCMCDPTTSVWVCNSRAAPSITALRGKQRERLINLSWVTERDTETRRTSPAVNRSYTCHVWLLWMCRLVRRVERVSVLWFMAGSWPVRYDENTDVPQKLCNLAARI